MKGKIYLVGAGCGEEDLITVRGLELLKKCDAVVYDDLIAPGLLDVVPKTAEKVYMGKRLGSHSAKQQEINEKLKELGRRGLMTVRLKGGDPFVFGRGGEEIEALQKAGLDFELVPGISSCIAIPGEAGIPVTHRGLSRSFHVITAHTKDSEDALPKDMERLAGLDGTIVILMGLNKLEAIADKLIASGKDRETPAAVISGGNSEHPKVVKAALHSIFREAEKAGVKAPAVIVIGENAALDFAPTRRPLKGVKIGLTGTESIQSKLRASLRELGASTFEAEKSRIDFLEIPGEMLEKLADGRPNWIMFTSGSGVRAFFAELRKKEFDLRRIAACKFAVIGNATGNELKKYGFCPDLCPERYTGVDLANALCKENSVDGSIFLFRSRIGNREIVDILSGKYTVFDIPVYDIHPDEGAKEYAQKQMESADYLTFSSGSGVELFLKMYGEIPEHVKCVCIGDVTAKALKAVNRDDFILAKEISADGIVQAILEETNG